MDDARLHRPPAACLYCRVLFRNTKLPAGSQSFLPPTCPKCGLVQPFASCEPPLSEQEERKLLSDRIDLLNRRLASLESPLFRP